MKLIWKNNFRFMLWNSIHSLPHFLVKKWHKVQIAYITREAYNNVPMYKIFWDKHGSYDIFKKSDNFLKLPVINKKVICSFDQEQRLHKIFSEDKCEWRETSGSTGETFRFPANQLYMKYFADRRFVTSARRRFLIWNGMSLNHILRMKTVHIGCSPSQLPSWQYLFIPFSEFNSDPEAVFKKIAIFGPDLMESMTTTIEKIACYKLNVNPIAQFSIDHILASGEKMTKAQRDLVKRAFSCDPYNIYGLEEIGVVGTECHFHYGFHIAEESYLVEILDSDENPLPAGTFGRVVITSFYNYAMPFIKYDTGDEGMILPNLCPCGLNSRLIINGRKDEHLLIGDVCFNTIEINNFMDEFSDIVLRYQIMKTAKGEMELYIIPTSVFNDGDIAAISEKWHKKFKIIPKVILVDSLIINKRGKTPVIINGRD